MVAARTRHTRAPPGRARRARAAGESGRDGTRDLARRTVSVAADAASAGRVRLENRTAPYGQRLRDPLGRQLDRHLPAQLVSAGAGRTRHVRAGALTAQVTRRLSEAETT